MPIFVFTFIRLLERSYFCTLFLKGLINVLFLVLDETSIIKNWLPATHHKNSFIGLKGVMS